MENSTLWKKILNNDDASLLRVSLIQMKDNISPLLQTVHHDLPGFTLHDITHVNALWHLAGFLIEPEELNPMELFVFGAAALIHDAAMTVAAFPGGIEKLQKDPLWEDLAATKKDELEIVQTILRLKHASNAAKLAQQEWEYKGKKLHLIESPDLRESLGEIIGKIAASHEWPVSKLEEEFPQKLGAMPGTPLTWTVDALKLACLLRIADAMHIDASRAPRSEYILRRPSGISQQHWKFHKKIQQPNLVNDTLIYTSSSAFQEDDCDGWWLCYDWLRMLQRELTDVDILLERLQRKCFKARRVAGVETPLVFAKHVRTRGWQPVDTSLRISNIKELITRLGGKALYGKDDFAPIRELVQNASDAVRAREALYTHSPYKGRITIELEERDDGRFLIVEDNGVGMSELTLANEFLDFGKSFWHSERVYTEHPGLAASGFTSGGRFGIGFFSAFLLGNEIKVTSRHHTKGHDDTYALEFRSGLARRPILKKVAGTRLPMGGTSIEIKITQDFLAEENIPELLAYRFPALQVSLYFRENKEEQLIIEKNDWLSIAPKKLFERISARRRTLSDNPVLSSMNAGDGKVSGRAGLTLGNKGVIVDEQGIFICTTDFFSGIVVGAPVNAARSQAQLGITKEVLAQWATEQAKRLYDEKIKADNRFDISFATMILCAGGELGDLPFLKHAEKLINEESFEAILKESSEIQILYYDDIFYNYPVTICEKDDTKFNLIWQENSFQAIPHFTHDPYLGILNNFDFVPEDVLKISGVVAEDSKENPVINLIRQLIEKVWGEYREVFSEIPVLVEIDDQRENATIPVCSFSRC